MNNLFKKWSISLMTTRGAQTSMPSSNMVRLAVTDKIVIGKPARMTSVDLVSRIERGLGYNASLVEAHLQQYFMLGKMQAPRLLLVLVVDKASAQENVALKANEILTEGFGGTAIDIFAT